jgi:hypothetical protein
VDVQVEDGLASGSSRVDSEIEAGDPAILLLDAPLHLSD